MVGPSERTLIQNDFVKLDGSLLVPAAKTVPHIEQLLRAARERGVRVV